MITYKLEILHQLYDDKNPGHVEVACFTSQDIENIKSSFKEWRGLTEKLANRTYDRFKIIRYIAYAIDEAGEILTIEKSKFLNTNKAREITLAATCILKTIVSKSKLLMV